MLEKMREARDGHVRLALPSAIVLVVACVMGLVFYPMAHMEMRDLPFAVLSLDEGAQMPAGQMNAGNMLVENVTSAAAGGDAEEGGGDGVDSEAATSPIAWTALETQGELDEALENNEFYGALVIPEDFTQAQMTAQAAAASDGSAEAAASALPAEAAAALAAGNLPEEAAEALAASDISPEAAIALAANGAASASSATEELADEAARAAQQEATEDATAAAEAPAIKIILDNAKSPLVAQQMQSAIGGMFEQLGVQVEVEVIHQGAQADEEDAAASANPMSAMMGQQVAIMPLCMAAMICAVVIGAVLLPMRGIAEARERWKRFGVQAAVLAVTTLVAALCAFGLTTLVAGLDAPADAAILFFWLGSFAIGLLLIGALDLAVPLGALVILCVFALGMTTGMMPHEALPAFWQDWVLPWAPQNYLGQGLRDILFMGAGAWNVGSGPLTIIGAAGLGLMILAVLIPRKQGSEKA
ncbi:hypothetical protein B5F41_06750 [Gordonibacter sp. An232A]|nr:hypothetical protein B5F41_06750 [Gordonibacter sp. An232A]